MLRRLALTAGLAILAAGCSVGSPERAAASRRLPQNQRERVWIYLLNSPLDRPRLGHLDQSAAYLRKAGYPRAKFVDWADTQAIAAEIRSARRRDPESRFVLIGWSGASLWAWDIADHLWPSREDTVIYLDSDWLINRLKEKSPPLNIDRVALMYRQDHTPPKIEGAEVRVIPTMHHLAVAANCTTLNGILDECDRLANRKE
jgi:hypothetical protein